MEDSRLDRLEKEISELKSKLSGGKPKKEKKQECRLNIIHS